MIANSILDFQLLSVSDAELLAEVALRAYTDHYLHLWHDGGAWYINRSFTPEVLRRELDNPNARFYLVQQHGQPVGFLKLNLHQPSPCQVTVNALELERIYLINAVTGLGIGRACMQFVIEQARQLQKEVVWLKSMDSSHDALAFYGKMGFEPCGTDRLPFEVMKEAFRGMIVLHRTL
ncbi:GNAT family N-acetyltransferase [Spirosoma utsteinense]|uniref:GNAT superfamily N-acetyltransferase n=1 Tax=Spirosoma utsteinense TaxID=2585773 RepID=A0ABR6W9S2_9BACT|nr:GNAT family N-acetyltransferase [Spirosoma utsteinense]MBC3787227.1 GNAT superfamily N-acetyltransferase [Spirosoma utsteinense]MBC3792913.1 GNAT superfamily N-acetyltransferase [Spirosoma utsteinense]